MASTHGLIAEFCIMYIVFFFVILSLTPLTIWPIPGFTLSFGGFTIGPVSGIGAYYYEVTWIGLMVFAVVSMMGTIIAINILNVEVAASGLHLDTKQLSTLAAGLIFCSMLGATMQLMIPTVPFQVSLPLVWAPIGLLCYSLIIDVGVGNG